VAEAQHGRLVERAAGDRQPSGRPSHVKPAGTASTGRPSVLNGRVSREKRPMRRTISSTGGAVTARAPGRLGIVGVSTASTWPNTSSTNSRVSRARRRPACR
jgi:hypothetical protein